MSSKALIKTLVGAVLALLALALPAAASAAPSTGAVVFSKSSGSGEHAKGGLFAVRDGRLNQLTEDPTDSEPDFAPDGRTIAFARGGDLYSVRPDGSGEKHLTSGAALDSAPLVSPNGRLVVFERRISVGGASMLYVVGINGGGLRVLTSGGDDREATFSPDGRIVVFVRATAPAGAAASAGNPNDDLYSVRTAGGAPTRLTSSAGVDEFDPHYFAGGILFSRGESTEGPAAYADVYTMRRDGSRVKSQVAGVGSAYVEDVSPDGHVVLFRRDQGLWVKRIGPGKARKLTELPDGSKTSSVFSSDGSRVAAFVAHEEEETLVSIEVRTGRQTYLAEGFGGEGEEGTVIGPVIAWQPVP